MLACFLDDEEVSFASLGIEVVGFIDTDDLDAENDGGPYCARNDETFHVF